jgi:5-methyltetrahydropteroyltriglutamate--homocysteine methyltransferase
MARVVEAELTGVFPRSEKLIEATRAAARGRVPQSDVDGILVEDVKSLVELQKSTFLAAFIDGQLNWQDLFRPFSELFTGIRPGALTRWFDNNTFYRKPVVVEKVTFRGSRIDEFFQYNSLPTEARRKAILPGPVTFATFAENSAYQSLADLADDLAHALRETVAKLQKVGYTCFQFNEPVLTANGARRPYLEMGKHTYEVCAKGLGSHTTLQTYFGDAAPLIDELLDFPVDCVGLDFYATSISSLTEHDFSKELGCGCIDGRNSLLETANSLGNFVSEVKNRLNPRSIRLGPNCDLDFLPEVVAEKKVHLLAETKAKLVT